MNTKPYKANRKTTEAAIQAVMENTRQLKKATLGMGEKRALIRQNDEILENLQAQLKVFV